MRYGLPQAVRDFGLTRLAKGAEAALSQKITYGQKAGTAGMNSTKWRYSGQEVFGEMEEFLLLYHENLSVIGADERYHRAEICIDQKYGEFVCAHCDCGTFMSSTYSCVHTEALLMAYFIDSHGVEALRGTDLEKEIQRITQIEDPLIPGVLRRTDSSLNRFKKMAGRSAKSKGKPIWISDPKQKPGLNDNWNSGRKIRSGSQISLECILIPLQGVVSVEIKAGPGRHYVIRQQQELLEAYRDNMPYSFGKNYFFPVGKEHFSREDGEIMDFFLTLYESYKRVARDHTILPFTGSERRAFLLGGRELDAFMELMDRKKVILDGHTCMVELDRESSGIEMVKETFGASLKLRDEKLIGSGLSGMYLRQDDWVIRLSARQWETRKALIEAGKYKKDLYVQDKDIPAVCDVLRKMDPGFEHVSFYGMLPQIYLPEIPRIQIYLDYSQEYLISCKVLAAYTKNDNKYNIFDQKKDKRFRNLPEEENTAKKLWGFFNAFDAEEKMIYCQCNENELYLFLTERISHLSEIGEVYISDSMKKLKIRQAGSVTVGIQMDSGSFIMSLQSNIMDRQEMIQVLNAYSRKKKYTRLKNGEFISFDKKSTEVWETLAEVFKNYGSKNPEAMKIPLYRALYYEEMLGKRNDISLQETDEFRRLAQNLKSEDSWNYQVPDTLADVMRRYQKEGFRWIKMLKSNGFGGILADDMGLGKTLQILAFLLSEKEEGKSGDWIRTLIITPASLLYNWKKEVETFTPSLRCKVIAGTIKERQEIIHRIKKGDTADIYITSYDLLKRDVAEYEDVIFANEIIDEAQYIKNQMTQVSKGVRLINSQFRMALTGTPIENRLSELWSIFDYLMPGFLFNYSRFRAEYEAPVINNKDQKVMERLRRMVHPFVLRRLKKDVLKDLPDKLEETITVELEKEQRKLYDAYAERLRLSLDEKSAEEFHNGKIEILAELTKLRQICCGPEVLLEKYKGGNAKKEACMELIHQAMEGGHKILLFSQFTKVLDILCEELKDKKINYHRIDGSTGKKDRMEMVESFAHDDIPVFCISLKAGGTGLNLTAADIVIHYDPWWNVAAQNQATDRTHRIGQENTVVVYQLIAAKTIEQQIVKLQQTKAKLAEDVLSGEGISSILIDKEELLSLL